MCSMRKKGDGSKIWQPQDLRIHDVAGMNNDIQVNVTHRGQGDRVDDSASSKDCERSPGLEKRAFEHRVQSPAHSRLSISVC